jgi:glutamine amidotransferase
VKKPWAAVCDYGMGNIHSAAKALERAGFAVRLAASADEVHGDVCVLPGVGHFQRCRQALDAAGLAEPVKDWAGAGRPLLAICIGAQLLMDGSDEAPGTPGLGLVAGTVRRLVADRIPHMGWDHVQPGPAGGTLFPLTERFYFVHSFGLDPIDDEVVAGRCDYGGGFAAALSAGNIVATQFHPEKSGRAGLELLGRVREGI